jgi:DNA-binding transcriptional MerR regulator
MYTQRDTGVYTAADLRHLLAQVRGWKVPAVTLKYWRRQLGISPDDRNLYFESDLQMLRALVRWLARGGTIPQFMSKVQEKNNASRFQ